MASCSRSRRCGSSSQGSCPAPGGAPAADDAHLGPHAALVSAARERRLAEAEQLVRVGDDYMEKLQDEIRAPDAQIRALQQPRATDGKAHVLQEPRATDAKAHALQQPRAAAAKAHAVHGSGTSGRGVTRQVGRRRELRASKRVRYHAGINTIVPRTSYRALRMRPESPSQSSSDESVGFDTSIDSTSDEGEVGNDPPRHKSLRMNTSPGFPGRSTPQAKQPRRRS